MIRMMVLYPKAEGTTFDADYWATKHMPLLTESWPTMLRWEADKGDDNSPYHGLAHIYFDSPDDVNAAMGAEGTAKIMADVANYTNIQPQIVMHEVIATS